MPVPHRLRRLNGERMTKFLRKNIFREIRDTWKRFLSIALMAFLGAGFFAGINASSTDMQLACDTYLDQQNCFDLEVMSTLGLTQDDVDAILQVKGIRDAAGAYSENVLVDIGEGDEKVKLLTIPEKDSINQLYLVEGEMAEQADECVVPQSLLDITGKKIGDRLDITETLEEDEESSFRYTSLTITGVVNSPLFIFSSSGSNERSTGAVADYLYVPANNVTEDYFTEIYATADGAAQLDSFDDAYETKIDNEEVLLKAIAEEREQARYDQITGEANAEIDDAQAELDEEAAEGQRKLDDAQAELDEARQKIQDGRKELNDSRLLAQRKFADAQAQIDRADAKIADAWRQYRRSEATAKKKRAELVQQRKTVTEQLKQLKQTRKETVQTLADLQEKRAEVQQTLDELQAKRTEAEQALAPLLEQRTALADGIAQYQEALDTYTEQLEQAQQAREQMMEAGMDTTELDAQIEQLTEAIAQIEAEKAGYDAQLEQLDAGIQQAEEGIVQIDAGIQQAEAGIARIDDGIKQAEDGIARIDDGISQAENGLTQIADGIRQIDAGLASGKAEIQQAEAELSAAKRELATSKSKAYAEMGKAEHELDEGQKELEDGIEELAIQKADFDKQIADAQKEIDEAREKVGDINRPTWYVLTRDGNNGISSFDQDSSNLKKLGFTFPLIFFLVAVLISLSSMTRMVEEQRGLIGTFQALITTGFGLRDSIVALIPLQYEDVMHYDMIAVAGTDVDEEAFADMAQELRQESVVKDALEIHAESIKIVTENGKTHELELFVPSDAEAFRNYISLLDTESEEELTLSGDEVILTQQIAEMLQVSVGDSISLRQEDGTKADVVVGAIVHNYLSHYAFLSQEGYESIYGEAAEGNAFVLHTTETTGEAVDAFTRQMNNDSRYAAVSATQAAKDAVDDRFSLLDQVVWVLIVAAAALAIVVLYNLSNINISERIRELATIKVLGFYDMEVYQYNTRESIILTLLGTLVGLGGGRWLTNFILKTMEMQGIVFEPTVAWKSYVIAGVITIVFATVINFMSYFALKKINMVEALKSVE